MKIITLLINKKLLHLYLNLVSLFIALIFLKNLIITTYAFNSI